MAGSSIRGVFSYSVSLNVFDRRTLQFGLLQENRVSCVRIYRSLGHCTHDRVVQHSAVKETEEPALVSELILKGRRSFIDIALYPLLVPQSLFAAQKGGV